MTLGKKPLEKNCEKRRMFSTPPKPNFNFLLIFFKLSANSFNLDCSTILLFGKELIVIRLFYDSGKEAF